MNREEIRECLAEKLAILDEIGINTAYQGRFIGKGRMSGLGRMLTERAELIGRLGALDTKLSAEGGNWQSDRLLAAAAQALGEKQQKVLATCRRVLTAARAEHRRLGAEIGVRRQMRRARDQYVNAPGAQGAGRRLNVKG